MNFWDFINIKSSCTEKETVDKTKRQPTEWDKIFANDISDKELVSKTYKECIKLNTQKTKQLIKLNTQKAMKPVNKWAEDMNRYFSKKTYKWPTDT